MIDTINPHKAHGSWVLAEAVSCLLMILKCARNDQADRSCVSGLRCEGLYDVTQ